MSKILKSKFKISRRLGVSVWGDGKDPFTRNRNYRPGQHGTGNRTVSVHGRQLNAKQLLKGHYGRIGECQFRNIFDKASKMVGDTAENLIGLLERRLDAVVYRLNFAKSVFAARQIVSHKHIMVKRKNRDYWEVVNCPSYVLSEGDQVKLTDKAKSITPIASSVQLMERKVPEYVRFDQANFEAEFIRVPKLADVPFAATMEPQLVVEFYSKN
ncbi:MAG: 30S ribosomal protein S4 [Pseudomonadota bacterium]